MNIFNHRDTKARRTAWGSVLGVAALLALAPLNAWAAADNAASLDDSSHQVWPLPHTEKLVTREQFVDQMSNTWLQSYPTINKGPANPEIVGTICVPGIPQPYAIGQKVPREFQDAFLALCEEFAPEVTHFQGMKLVAQAAQEDASPVDDSTHQVWPSPYSVKTSMSSVVPKISCGGYWRNFLMIRDDYCYPYYAWEKYPYGNCRSGWLVQDPAEPLFRLKEPHGSGGFPLGNKEPHGSNGFSPGNRYIAF